MDLNGSQVCAYSELSLGAFEYKEQKAPWSGAMHEVDRSAVTLSAVPIQVHNPSSLRIDRHGHSGAIHLNDAARVR